MRLEQYLRRSADRQPDRIAVVMGAERLTYAELEEASNRLAHQLMEFGCRPGDRVCLFLPKAPVAIVAMLAVLKTGGAYVPVDLNSPASRLAKVIGSAEPSLLLAQKASARLAVEARDLVGRPSAQLALIDDSSDPAERSEAAFAAADWQAQPSTSPVVEGGDQDPAHILFTSGSTGVPKGVVITHLNVATFIDWAVDYFGIGADDRLSGHSPLYFDLSTFDIYGALAVGAELHIVPPAANLLPHQLAEFIRRSELTQWFSVPSALVFMLRAGAIRQGDFASLRRLLWCGEVLPTPSLAELMRLVPHPKYCNLYGPTETTIASTYYAVPAEPVDESRPVPIGLPCGGEDVSVVDERLRPVPNGTVGELCISGAGLSPGYWRDEERTAEAFVRGPSGARMYRTGDLGRRDEAGLLHFLGRNDSQVKSRGYRIELGEVEATMQTLPGLAELAVVALQANDFSGVRICCAYVLAEGEQLSSAQVRMQAARALPAYMVPSDWLSLEALPRTANGKIDRPQLRRMFAPAERNAQVAAGTRS
jgi:amino acid adenylation domain-containing protein